MKCEDCTFCRLGNLVTFTSGGTPSKSNPNYWNGNIPWISAKTMKMERVSTSDLFITEDGLQAGSRLAKQGSILILTRGSGLFNDIPICLVEKDLAFNQDIKCLNSCTSIDNKFIFYWLLSQKEYLSAKVGMTGIGAGKFDTDFLMNLMVPIFSTEVRNRIVAIADSISKKIAINRAINDNLLAQAQTLYKQFFPYGVQDDLPDGWRIGTVGEIIEIHDSKRIPLSGADRSKMEKKIYPYYGAASLMDLVDNYIFDGKYLLLGEDGTVVDDAGYPILQYVWGQFWVNNHAHILTGRLGYDVESLYMLFKQTPVKSIVTGAVQPKISQANLRSVQVVIPPEHNLREYNDLVEPLFSLFRANEEECKIFTALRDTLLPKLMSGEIDVSDVQL